MLCAAEQEILYFDPRIMQVVESSNEGQTAQTTKKLDRRSCLVQTLLMVTTWSPKPQSVLARKTIYQTKVQLGGRPDYLLIPGA